METRHLRLVKAIVEDGSITRAIESLHLTQSALSHQLKEAENQLGTAIFHRINKKLVLTRAGEKVYNTACEVLEKLSQAHGEIRKMVLGEEGEIRLSTECYTSYHWLPSLMRQFQKIHPLIDLKIVMEATHYPLQKLLAAALDIAITSDPVKDENISYLELFEDEMVALVPENHEWATKKFVRAEDFAGQNLIIHSLPLETVTIHQAVLAPAGISPKKITVLPLTEASVEMVKAEMGIMVMAQWALRPYLQTNSLRTIRIGPKGLKRKHFAAMLKNREHPAYITDFIAFLKKELRLD